MKYYFDNNEIEKNIEYLKVCISETDQIIEKLKENLYSYNYCYQSLNTNKLNTIFDKTIETLKNISEINTAYLEILIEKNKQYKIIKEQVNQKFKNIEIDIQK